MCEYIRESTGGRIVAVDNQDEEIGCISYVTSNMYMSIQFYQVRPGSRRKNVGRKLVNKLVEVAIRYGINEIHVYPKPYSVEGEPLLNVRTLYEIYKKMGFQFQESDINLDECNHLMILKIYVEPNNV